MMYSKRYLCSVTWYLGTVTYRKLDPRVLN